MKVMIGLRGRVVDLGPTAVLGVGGEGTVFRGPKAIKVYHDPTPERAEKLRAFLKQGFSLPREVIVPEDLVLDQSGRRIVGFTMRLLPSGQQVMDTLSSRKHRAIFRITNKEVADIFIRLHGVLRVLHESGLVVGDLNPLNQFYKGTEIAITDADSFQFGPYPCKVATVRCLEPRLYGVDLSKTPLFIPEDDWYAYLVLLFSSLLLVHPYAGVHRKLRTIPKRALAGISVFDPSVVYPDAAYPPEVVSDELLALFEDTFTDGWRGEPPLDLVREYRSVLIGCDTCGLWYPSNRRQCPECRAVNKLVRRLQTVVRGIRVVELLATKGPIVFFRLIGNTLFCVASEQGQAVLYVKESLKKPRRVVLFKAVQGARYDVFDHYLVVCPHPYEEQPQILLFDISTDVPKPILVTSTERFGSRGAVFRGSGRYLYRLVGGVLMRGHLPYGTELIEELAATVIDNQTWFDASSTPGQNVAFGYFRVFSKIEWFLLLDGAYFPVTVSPLEVGETMVDRSIRFSASSLLLLRRTKRGGEEFCRFDVVDIQTGSLASSRRVSLLDNPHFADIHQLAYAQGTCLLATGSGLLAENAESGQQRVYPDTANYVRSGDRLWRFEDGILAVSSIRVIKVVLERKGRT